MNFKEAAEKNEQWIIEQRRYFHAHPELSYKEVNTTKEIGKRLEEIGLTPHYYPDFNGLWAMIESGQAGQDTKTVALRADIDALPIEEHTGLEFCSQNPGVMHACGHDGHATWLIGAAKILARLTDEFGGCIRFAFQPGEEVGLGADTMIKEDKVLENPKIDMAFAAHGWPSVESGKIGIVRRYAFGCVGGFKVKIIGKKGHASWPEQAVDPIAIANEIYQHLPAILTRTVSGTEPKILSVTYMQAGDTSVSNIIPQECVFGGTMRAVKKEVLEKIREEFHKEIEAAGYERRYSKAHREACKKDI